MYADDSWNTSCPITDERRWADDNSLYEDYSSISVVLGGWAYKAPKASGRFESNGWHLPSPYGRATCSVSTVDGTVSRPFGGFPKGLIQVYTPMDPLPANGPSSFMYEAPYASASNGSAILPPNMTARCDTETDDKFGTGDLNLGMNILEAKETIGQISEQSIALIRAYSAARRNQWGKCLKYLAISHHTFTTKSLASRWLELQFGWLPLMSDIHAAYKLFGTAMTENMPMRAVRMIGETHNTETYEGSPIRYTARHEWNETISVKNTVWYYINDSRLAWASSLGLLNPADLYWEKIPFSFVVDWFLPVGNLLQACTNMIGLTFLSGTRTSTWEGSCKRTYLNDDMSLSSVSQTFIGRSYNRGVISGWPIPNPYYKNPFSSTRLADCIALIAQHLK